MSRLSESFITRPLAHRGLHDAARGVIENSVSAVVAAVDAGFGIEIDLQLSADDQAIVFHDYELSRLTGETGEIRDRTAAELREISLTGSDDKILPLAEILECVKGRAPLLIELKDQERTLGPTDGLLEKATVDALEGYGGPVALMSFNPNCVAALAKLAPDIPRGLTTDAFDATDYPDVAEERRAVLRAISDYDRVGACFISHDINDLGRARVADLKARGARVLCWTVKNPEQEVQARRIAENITFEGYKPSAPGP